jgi:hypothetical protein
VCRVTFRRWALLVFYLVTLNVLTLHQLLFAEPCLTLLPPNPAAEPWCQTLLLNHNRPSAARGW